MSHDTDRIRMLNDELRQHLIGGGAVITPGIAALGSEAVNRLVQTIAVFDDFCTANDPYSEHDFGELQLRRHVSDVQDRLLRQEPQLALARSRRSKRHGAGHYDHACRRILDAAHAVLTRDVRSSRTSLTTQNADPIGTSQCTSTDVIFFLA